MISICFRVSFHPRVHLRDPAHRYNFELRKHKVKSVNDKQLQQMSKSAMTAPRIKGRTEKVRKRKKRSSIKLDFLNLNDLGGNCDCMLTPINVTQLWIQLKTIDEIKYNKSISNNKYPQLLRATDIKLYNNITV